MDTMKILMVLLLVVTCWNSSGSVQSNKTASKFPVELPVTDEDDSEQGLSLQLEEVDGSGGWSAWSDWSPCSRSCDGGASHQLRTCTSGNCRGEHVRYKICNMQAIVAFFAALAATNAGLVAPSARIIQGSSSRTTVAGPDGSVISSVAPGGQIITEDHAGYAAHTAPVVSAYAAPVVSAYAAPVVSAYAAHGAYGYPGYTAYSSPVVSAYSAPVVSAYAAPSVVASGVVAHNSVDTVVAGPSGTIATSKTVASPAFYSAPGVYAAHGVHGLYL